MDVKNLETFVMVNELKSFTLAAGRLGYTQSTVSFQIKQLEKELSIPLFERIGHTVTLTNEGEKLLPLAQQILRLAAEATHISGNTAPEGLVRIAIAESLASWEFHSRFKDFHEKYPGIRLKIIATSTDEMFQMLGQNQVDIVYTIIGLLRGIVILVNTCHFVAPSIIAASSIVLGIVSKNPFAM